MKATAKVFGVIAMAAVLATASTTVQAANGYPKMAVTINTSKSGSAVDYGARALAKVLTTELGANVIVNSCADQIEAVRQTISAEPDGYTLCYVNNTVVINDVDGTTNFDSIEDVTIVGAPAMGVSSWIGMRADRCEELGITDLASLIAYTGEHPDELTITDSPSSSTHAAISLLRDKGLLAQTVVAGKADERLTTLLAGACDIYVGSYSYLDQYVQTGELVCLASCSQERSVFSPDVPCTYELGVEVEFPVYYYVCGPKDLPEDVVKVLEDAMEKVTQSEEYIEDLKGNANEPNYLNSEAATKLLTGQKDALKAMAEAETAK